MKLENEFTVPAPVERAWDVLLDLRRVAPCLPGAAIEGSDGDEHRGTMTIKIGPITARYKGTVRIEESDAEARRAVMRAQASDQKGQGTAAATITSTMEAVAEGTRVRVVTDMRVTGPAAQFGRGVMQDVSKKMMGRFAECLAAEIAHGEAAGAASAAAAPTAGEAPAAPPAGEAPAAAEPAGTAGVALPPGPAGESAEAAARARAAVPPARPVEETAAGDDVASPPRPRPTADVLDLGEASREAVLKRAVPAAAGLVALVVLLRVLLRRR
jgi:carbon monoxide dehydrogenase subunit G